MKRFVQYMLFVALSASIVACSVDREEERIISVDDQVELTITTSRPETVSSRTMVAEDGITPMWCPGDAIGVSVLTGDSYTNNEFISESTEVCKITAFTGRTPITGKIYTYYPFSSRGVDEKGVAVVDIPAIQHPTPTSFDGISDLLVGKPLSVSPLTSTKIEGLQFKRMGGFLKIVLKDRTSEGLIRGRSVNRLSVRAESDLAGSVGIDVIHGELGEICGNESKVVTADYSLATTYQIGDEAAATYLGVYPQTLAEGTAFTIIAEIEKYVISKKIILPQPVKIAAGQITTVTVNVMEENIGELEPFLLEVNINGVKGVQIDETAFQIKVPYGTKVTALEPEFVTNGATVELKDEQSGSKGTSTIDLSSPVTVILTSPTGRTKEYKVAVYYSNLPIVYVKTPEKITSKDVWMEDCSIQIWNAGDENDTYSLVQMKGRGNTTWGQPKKPYAIKLNKKAEVLGMPKHKRWVLLANYLDVSGLRNEICFYMGRMSKLPYTPRTRFVEVVMNGEYVGLYQMTEQLKIDDNRVDVGDDGFLLEIDSRAGQDPEDIYFRVPHISRPLVIKDPDVVEGDDAYNFIKQYLTDASEALFSEEYMDEKIGWRKWLDAESFVDWYLINEISRNNDAIFFSSCYMSLKRGDKLMMGPLWDFDLAIANTTTNDSKNPIGFWIKRVAWYARLFTDPYFVDLVKERFSYFYENRQRIYDELYRQQEVIDEAMTGNEWKWNRMGTKGDAEKAHQQLTIRIETMTTWLETRFNWLKGEFDSM